MQDLSVIYNLPELSFVDSDIEARLAKAIKDYEDAYFAQTGKRIKLYAGDPIRIYIYTQTLKLYQAELLIDFAAKQNFIRYASADYLDNLAATRASLLRLPAQKALVTIKFTLSTILSEAKIIPSGTRVTAGDNIFFVCTDTFTIEAGEIEASSVFECMEYGEVGNNYVAGQINTLVDPIAYIQSVENTDISQGGSEIESDDNLRLRTFLAPESFAVAGPELAYVARIKDFSQTIQDVSVTTPEPGNVTAYVILTNGVVPETAFLTELHAFVDDRRRRPLTDQFIVSAPSVVNYDIELTYYIDTNKSSISTQIQNNVNAAIAEYIIWQKSEIGRDINPSELIKRIVEAGAKRVNLVSPAFTALNQNQIGINDEVDVTFGGLEIA